MPASARSLTTCSRTTSSMSQELREAVRKARAQTGLAAGGAPLPRPPNLAEARRHVQDVQRAQHPQLPGQTPLLRRAKGAAYRAPKEPRGAVGGLRVVPGSSPVPRWKALEASYLRGEAGLSCAQGQRRWRTPNPSSRSSPAVPTRDTSCRDQIQLRRSTYLGSLQGITVTSRGWVGRVLFAGGTRA